MAVDLTLLKMARASLLKRAFVPAGDPAAGGAPPGAPPMDPMAGGGAPPMDPMAGGGAPPMDPMAGGGAPPPMDPAMMGGAPPMPPMDPSAMPGGMGGTGDIQQMIRDELRNAGLGAGPGQAGGNGKPPKPDINTIATDVFQLKKMFLHFLRMQGIELPPDILDGPNRDPQTGAPSSSPTGGSSDVGAAPAGPSPAIAPIQPIQPAMAPPSGGEGKTASVGRPVALPSLHSRARALAERLRPR